MELFILNKNFDHTHLIDSFISFIWTERFNAYGDFELKLPINDPAVPSIRTDRYLRLSRSSRLMIIRTIEKSVDSEEGDILTIKGRSLESWLLDRVLFPNARGEDGEYEWSGRLASLATTLVRNRCVLGNKESEFDIIPNLRVISPTSPGEQYTLATKAKDLYSVVQDLCFVGKFGFRITHDHQTKQHTFRLYDGVDRSESRVFSPTFDTLHEINHYTTTENFKTTAYVYHKDFEDVVMNWQPGWRYITGTDRRVLYVDASELDNPTREELVRWGRDALNSEENRRRSVMDGEIVQGGLAYGTHYNLGDMVTFEDNGVREIVRVSEYIFSYDSEGLKEYPTFEEVED